MTFVGIFHLFVGTFNIFSFLTMAIALQVFVILGDRKGFIVPLMFCLLPSKDAYDRLFGIIRAMWPQLVPDAVATDFEISLFQSVEVNLLLTLSLGQNSLIKIEYV